MKQFDLEEYLKNPWRKVVTRDGRNVTIHCTNYYANQAIIAEIEGLDVSYAFDIDGTFSYGNSPNDLFFASEKHEGWFNIYHSDESGFYVRQNHPYKSKHEADEIAKANPKTFFATTKVEWEE